MEWAGALLCLQEPITFAYPEWAIQQLRRVWIVSFLSYTDYVAQNGISVNDELGRMWKDLVMMYYNVYRSIYIDGLREYHKSFSGS
jgi:hypothetical protein